MSDDTKQPRLDVLEEAGDLAYKAMRDHFKDGGEPVLDKDGEVVGRRVNAQVLAALFREMARHNVGVVPTTGAARDTLKEAERAIPGLELDFPDDPTVPPHLRQ